MGQVSWQYKNETLRQSIWSSYQDSIDLHLTDSHSTRPRANLHGRPSTLGQVGLQAHPTVLPNVTPSLTPQTTVFTKTFEIWKLYFLSQQDATQARPLKPASHQKCGWWLHFGILFRMQNLGPYPRLSPTACLKELLRWQDALRSFYPPYVLSHHLDSLH